MTLSKGTMRGLEVAKLLLDEFPIVLNGQSVPFMPEKIENSADRLKHEFCDIIRLIVVIIYRSEVFAFHAIFSKSSV